MIKSDADEETEKLEISTIGSNCNNDSDKSFIELENEDNFIKEVLQTKHDNAPLFSCLEKK